MNKIFENKQGISLIVLIITIIVMIILAGTIIITLNNSGIIQKASEAVDKTDEATVKELAQLAWAEAYADGVRTVEDLADGTKGFRARVEETLEKNNIDLEDYGIVVTTSGVEVAKGWLKNGFTVVKGKQVLELGDTVAYDETAGGTKTGLTATDWQVLGADADGNLLLMSTEDVGSLRLGYESTMTDAAEKLAECQKDWLNGAAELDSICEAYGYGKGAVGKARSITVEDVDKVTGYDKTTYGSGQLCKYGNVVTYSYNGTTKPAYTSVVTNGILSKEHNNGFYYYDGKEFKHITDLTTGTSGNAFAKLTNDAYAYYASNLSTISSETNTKAYQMIFGADDTGYWLTGNFYFTHTDYALFGVYCVLGDSDFVSGASLWASTGDTNYLDTGVRAVVTLSSDIKLAGSSATGWSY